MAWYGSEWRWRGEGSASDRGAGDRWRRSARRTGWDRGYGGEYRRPLIGERSIRAAGGTGYDYDYEGGEWGEPVNAPGFGTRGYYGTPGGSWTGRGRGFGFRPEGYRNTYDREFATEWPRGRPGAWRSGGVPAYDGEYEPESGLPGYGREYRRGWGSTAGVPGSEDFGEGLRRHYGRTPPDRWPAGASAWRSRRLDDEDIREAVRENLFQDSYIDPGRIDVNVDRGVVTLRGEVDDFLEARYAWDDAWESPGVRGVINHLTVRTDRASDEMDMPQSEG